MRVSVAVIVVGLTYLVAGCANSVEMRVGWDMQAQKLKSGTSMQQRRENLNESRVRTDAIAKYLNDGVTQ